MQTDDNGIDENGIILKAVVITLGIIVAFNLISSGITELRKPSYEQQQRNRLNSQLYQQCIETRPWYECEARYDPLPRGR